MKSPLLKIQLTIVIIGILLMGIKFFAWWITDSNALLTDALESIVNVVAGAFTLYSLYLSLKPVDADHPYGHGKVEYIAAGIEGSLIGIAGISMIVKATIDFDSNPTILALDFGILLAAAAGIINFIMGMVLVNKGKKSRSLAMIAGGKHLKSDGYTSAGMIAGLLIVFFTNELWLDNVIAISLGLILLYTCLQIIRKAIAGIMDETDMDMIEEVVLVLNQNRKSNWIDIHNLRVIKYGTSFHIDCHVTLPWYLNLRQAHDEMDEIQRIVEAGLKTRVEFFIHNDPCLPSSCSICTIADCKVRENDFIGKMEWNPNKLMQNQKHGIK